MYFIIRISNDNISKEYELETLEEVAILQTILKRKRIKYTVTARYK